MACIANVAFVLVGHTIPCNFLFVLASKPCSWRRYLVWLVCLRGGRPGRHRSDRWHALVCPFTVSATAHCCTWAIIGKVTLLSALVAHSPLVWASRLLGDWFLCLQLGWAMLGPFVPNLALFLNLVLVGLCMLLRSWASDGWSLLKILHHVSSRLSWEGCTFLFSFNTYKSLWSFSTSCLSLSFSLQ
jgi:hypothetical protein